MAKDKNKIRSCSMCGCTDDDCRQCIEKTGQPCHWVAEDLCSACDGSTAAIQKTLKPLKKLAAFNESVKKHFQLSDYEV